MRSVRLHATSSAATRPRDSYSMLGKRHELALGIISSPADRTARANIRASWLLAPAFADGRATARFVLGDVPCARAAAKGEKALHGDIAFVNASDCSQWH